MYRQAHEYSVCGSHMIVHLARHSREGEAIEVMEALAGVLGGAEDWDPLCVLFPLHRLRPPRGRPGLPRNRPGTLRRSSVPGVGVDGARLRLVEHLVEGTSQAVLVVDVRDPRNVVE